MDVPHPHFPMYYHHENFLRQCECVHFHTTVKQLLAPAKINALLKISTLSLSLQTGSMFVKYGWYGSNKSDQ